jgi:hypothetical protein
MATQLTGITFPAGVTQYFEPWGYLFQDIMTTDNITVCGNDFSLWILQIFLPIYPHFSQSLTQIILQVPNPAKYLAVNKTEATKFHYHYQMQHVSETAKILQCLSEHFSRKQKWWLCTIPLWQVTQMVCHLGRHTCRISWSNAQPQTIQQFKYWGNVGSENLMAYMTIYTINLKYKVQTNSNNLTQWNAQYHKVIL